MSRRDGRGAKNRRLIDKAPRGHWKITTFIAALRHTSLTAPRVLDGPINGESFRAWVEEFLLPTLAPGDGVVMDNLPAHKVTGIQPMIESCGAKRFYLLPYSPDLNLPFPSSSACAARTVCALWKTIGNKSSRFHYKRVSKFLQDRWL